MPAPPLRGANASPTMSETTSPSGPSPIIERKEAEHAELKKKHALLRASIKKVKNGLDKGIQEMSKAEELFHKKLVKRLADTFRLKQEVSELFEQISQAPWLTEADLALVDYLQDFLDLDENIGKDAPALALEMDKLAAALAAAQPNELEAELLGPIPEVEFREIQRLGDRLRHAFAPDKAKGKVQAKRFARILEQVADLTLKEDMVSLADLFEKEHAAPFFQEAQKEQSANYPNILNRELERLTKATGVLTSHLNRCKEQALAIKKSDLGKIAEKLKTTPKAEALLEWDAMAEAQQNFETLTALKRLAKSFLEKQKFDLDRFAAILQAHAKVFAPADIDEPVGKKAPKDLAGTLTLIIQEHVSRLHEEPIVETMAPLVPPSPRADSVGRRRKKSSQMARGRKGNGASAQQAETGELQQNTASLPREDQSKGTARRGRPKKKTAPAAQPNPEPTSPAPAANDPTRPQAEKPKAKGRRGRPRKKAASDAAAASEPKTPAPAANDPTRPQAEKPKAKGRRGRPRKKAADNAAADSGPNPPAPAANDPTRPQAEKPTRATRRGRPEEKASDPGPRAPTGEVKPKGQQRTRKKHQAKKTD